MVTYSYSKELMSEEIRHRQSSCLRHDTGKAPVQDTGKAPVQDTGKAPVQECEQSFILIALNDKC